ncbi:hypothetical protein K8T06_10975 [bacterium]|nr:hypothetical protein [bacterium]
MGLDITFYPVTISDPSAIAVYGAEAVYDPYFYHQTGHSKPTPRVIVIGGMKRPGGLLITSDKVQTLIPQGGNHSIWENILVESAIIPDLNDPIPDHERAFFATSLDYRDSTIHISGGEQMEYDSMVIVNDFGSINLLDSNPEWEYVQGPGGIFPDVSHHNSVFSLGNTVFCTEDWAASTPNKKLYIDFAGEGDIKTWDVRKDALYGLTNPEAVCNTRRIGDNDIVKIHQTKDYPYAVNDAYECNIVIPGCHKNVTLEGVIYNGVKPLLY